MIEKIKILNQLDTKTVVIAFILAFALVLPLDYKLRITPLNEEINRLDKNNQELKTSLDKLRKQNVQKDKRIATLSKKVNIIDKIKILENKKKEIEQTLAFTVGGISSSQTKRIMQEDYKDPVNEYKLKQIEKLEYRILKLQDKL